MVLLFDHSHRGQTSSQCVYLSFGSRVPFKPYFICFFRNGTQAIMYLYSLVCTWTNQICFIIILFFILFITMNCRYHQRREFKAFSTDTQLLWHGYQNVSWSLFYVNRLGWGVELTLRGEKKIRSWW